MTSAPVLLRAENLDKWFGATHALRGASVDVRQGEVHALVGSNGSGKSTVVKAIAGAIITDSGSVTLPNPDTAVGTVHQNLGLFDEATVRENICAVVPGALLSAGRESQVVERLFEQLGVTIDPEAAVRELPIDQQAFVAVARALAAMGDASAGVLVVDEVTSVLRGNAAKRFAEVLTRLRSRGIGVLLVSHDLDEVLELADRVTVIVDGGVKAVLPVIGLDRHALIEMMTGSAVIAASDLTGHAPDHGDAVLTVAGLGGELVEDLDLQVSPGEIVGVIGVPGSGYDEVPYLIAGSGTGRRRGRVTLEGHDISSPNAFARAGGALIPADRNRTALVRSGSVLENFMLGHRGGFGRTVLRKPRREHHTVASALTTFGVKAEGPNAQITSLSGGNQQKLILARCMERQPGLLVVHEPTQGVDVRARADLLSHIHRASADRRLAVLYVCGDLNEVWDNAHRVVVIRRGKKVADVSTDSSSKDAIHEYLY